MNATLDLPHSSQPGLLILWCVSWLKVWGLNIELGVWVVGSNPHKVSICFTSYILQNIVYITLTLKSVNLSNSFDCHTRYITCRISYLILKQRAIYMSTVQQCSTKVKPVGKILIWDLLKPGVGMVCEDYFRSDHDVNSHFCIYFAKPWELPRDKFHGNFPWSLLYILFMLTDMHSRKWLFNTIKSGPS